MSGRVRGPGRARNAETASAPWWRAVDLIVLAVLVTAGSVLLVPAYGSAAPVLATATGAFVSVLMLILMERFRLPGVLVGLGIAVLVVVLGSLVVAPALTLGPLPTIAGMSVVLRGTIDGWREMLTVATPTGVAGGLLVPPLIIGAVATALAGVLATTRRATLALFSPAVAMVVFALLGNRVVAPLVMAGVAGLFVICGMSWAVWVGSRARRRALARGGIAGPPANRGAQSAAAVTRQAIAARRVVISVAVLAIAVVVGTVAATAATPTRVALRDLVERPVDPAAFTSPLSLFRLYTKDQADVVQLIAGGLPAGGRLRLAALDAYDGRQFTVSDAEGPFVRIGRERPDPGTGVPTSVSVNIRGYTGSFLPLPGPIIELDFDGPRAAELTADLRYSESAATGLMPGGWQSGDQYTVLADIGTQPTAADLEYAAPLAAPFPSTVALPDLLRSKANSYVSGAVGAAAQVEAIRAGLAADGIFSHGGATDKVRSAAGHGLDRMTAMIAGVPMVGDQEQYATLMALMVRSIGLPARVAVGFVAPTGGSALPGGSTAAGPASQVVLRGRDISAWVEVPFEGYGWVAFDPSPSPDKQAPVTQDRSPTERRAVTVEVPPALPQAQPDAVDTENANQRPDSTDSDAQVASDDSSVFTVVLVIVGALLLFMAILAVPIGIILAVKAGRRRTRRKAAAPKDQITGGWEQLIDTAVDSGYRPAAWHTRTEAAADLQSSGVLQVDWLAPAADVAEFSPGPVNPESATSYWREVDDRSAELLGGLPLWRRWRARLSLASMRRADRRAKGS